MAEPGEGSCKDPPSLGHPGVPQQALGREDRTEPAWDYSRASWPSKREFQALPPSSHPLPRLFSS